MTPPPWCQAMSACPLVPGWEVNLPQAAGSHSGHGTDWLLCAGRVRLPSPGWPDLLTDRQRWWHWDQLIHIYAWGMYVRTSCVCVCVCVCVPVCLRCALYCMQTFLSWLSLLATGTSNPRTRTIVYILITSIWRDMAFQSTDLQWYTQYYTIPVLSGSYWYGQPTQKVCTCTCMYVHSHSFLGIVPFRWKKSITLCR